MKTIAQFRVEYRQYLDVDAQVVDALPDFATDPKHLLKLYEAMCLQRTFDTKGIAMQRTGKIGTYLSTLGQEAISVGVGDALDKDDVFLPYYRDIATQVMRGVRLSELLAYWGGDERGNAFQNNPHDFPMAVPIASQCLHAAGVGFALQYRKKPQAVLVTLGDGATSQGDFYEAINVSGAMSLPVVFVVNNNQWAISLPRSEQTACETLAQKAIAAGMVSEQVDGNDVIAVRQAVDEALVRARLSKKPSLVECVTYRMSDHSTADDASRYGDEASLKKAWLKEPIARFKNYLMSQTILNSELDASIQDRCVTLVKKEVEAYENRPPQQITDMFDYHYAHLPDALIEQRYELMEGVTNG